MNYSKKVMEHFQKPKHQGELKNYDAIGKVGNPICGDLMHVFIKVKDNRIKDIKFKTFGCAAAISSSDVVCGLAKGKTLEQAEKITKNDVVKALGGLPPEKIHCSLLGEEALKQAIKDYREKHKK